MKYLKRREKERVYYIERTCLVKHIGMWRHCLKDLWPKPASVEGKNNCGWEFSDSEVLMMPL